MLLLGAIPLAILFLLPAFLGNPVLLALTTLALPVAAAVAR